MNDSRRDFLKKSALFTVAATGVASSLDSIASAAEKALALDASKFSLPPLPYAYDALEPHIDKMTMEIHHTKHHQAYVNNLNKALADLGKKDAHGSLEEICKNISGYNTLVRNNAGGHFNHSLFWTLMKSNGGGVPAGTLSDAITSTFTSFDNF